MRTYSVLCQGVMPELALHLVVIEYLYLWCVYEYMWCVCEYLWCVYNSMGTCRVSMST